MRSFRLGRFLVTIINTKVKSKRQVGRPKVIDEKQLEILKLYEQGLSLRQIAARVGLGKSTIGRIINKSLNTK